jgi:hypothetical protein
MVATLRELFAKSQSPSQEDKESAAHALAGIIEAAQAIGRAHAESEGESSARATWGGKFTDGLQSAWDIVTNFVQNIASRISGQSPEDAQAAIDAEAETVAGTEVASAIEQSVLSSLQSQGFFQIAWATQPGACALCLANEAASPIPIGSSFPDGSVTPPAHPHCQCSISTPVGGDIAP